MLATRNDISIERNHVIAAAHWRKGGIFVIKEYFLVVHDAKRVLSAVNTKRSYPERLDLPLKENSI